MLNFLIELFLWNVIQWKCHQIHFQNFQKLQLQIPAENLIVYRFQNCLGNRPGLLFPIPNEHFRVKCPYFRFRVTSGTIPNEVRSHRRAASPWQLSVRRPEQERRHSRNRKSEKTWITKPRPRMTRTKDWSLHRYFHALKTFRKQILFKRLKKWHCYNWRDSSIL